MAVAATTELEAVNIMLAAIGEAPVSKLTGTLPVDVKIAQSTLVEINKAVQAEGWSFNTEIPEPARRYINIRSARIFVDRLVSDQGLRTYTKEDEIRARVTLTETDLNNGDHNILRGDPSLTSVFSTYNPANGLIR